tara:strand:+ start:2720 stop:3898 length:1179 start_codon:yes stop_codon:yes gene_type:complete
MNIVLINGGRGATSLINYLTKSKKNNIYSVVNAYDDGKSTGTIREFFNILGPSDIRKVQSLFLDKDNKHYKNYKKFFEYRFSSSISNAEAKVEINKIINLKNNKIINLIKIEKNKQNKIVKFLKIFIEEVKKYEKSKKILFNFTDCSIINCLYAGSIINYKKDISKAINIVSKIFDIRHKVLVNSNSERFLYAIRSNGRILESEKEIVEIRSNHSIDEIYLLKNKISSTIIDNKSIKFKKKYLNNLHSPPLFNPKIKQIFKKASFIIFCPGTQHSSLYPTYLTKGFLKVLLVSKAKKIYITNIGADYETPFYKASDYVFGAIKYLNKNNSTNIDKIFDLLMINNPKKFNKNYVELDKDKLINLKTNLIIKNFENFKKNGYHDAIKIFRYLNI